MTDDQWNNPWKDDPGHAADGDAQDESLDRTTIRPRGDATPGPGPSTGSGPASADGGTGGDAGNGGQQGSSAWTDPYPSSSASQGSAPDPWHDAASSASAQQDSPQPAHGWQGWDQPGNPAPSGQQWTSEETRPLNDPYSGVNPQAGQWPSGPGQYGQPSAGGPGGSQPSAPTFGQPGQQFPPQQAPGRPGQPAQPGQYGQQPPAGGFGQPQPGQYGQPAPAYGPNGGFPAPRPKAPGFFANLFDTTFTRFVSPTIIKVVYIILIVLVALWYIGAVIAGFVAGPLVGIITLIVGAGAALLIIALSRMQLEYIVALIRTSEYTRDLKDHFVKED